MPKQSCQNKPVQKPVKKCQSVPRESCTQVPNKILKKKNGAKRVVPIVYLYLYQVPRESCQSVPKKSCRSVPVQKPTKVWFWFFSIFIYLPDEGGKASLLRGWFSQVWRWLRWLPWLRNRVRLFVLSWKDLNKDYKQNSSIMLALKSSVKMP